MNTDPLQDHIWYPCCDNKPGIAGDWIYGPTPLRTSEPDEHTRPLLRPIRYLVEIRINPYLRGGAVALPRLRTSKISYQRILLQ